MRATGLMIRPMGEGGLSMGMRMCTKGSGKMTRRMAKGSIPRTTALVILVNGSRISSMDLELKNGRTLPPTKGSHSFMQHALLRSKTRQRKVHLARRFCLLG